MPSTSANAAPLLLSLSLAFATLLHLASAIVAPGLLPAGAAPTASAVCPAGLLACGLTTGATRPAMHVLTKCSASGMLRSAT